MVMKNNNTLIPLTKDKEGSIVVSGRNLYDFLEVKSDFTTWLKRMIGFGMFENGVNYVEVFPKNDENLSGGRPKKDIAMKLDMAKEISMIQRNEKGKQARQYFIQVEKDYQQASLPQTPEERLDLTMQVVNRSAKQLKELRTDVDELKDNLKVTNSQQKALLDTHHKSVFKALDGKESNAYKKIGKKVFMAAWNEFKKAFYLPRYQELPQIKFDEGMTFLKEWKPNTELRLEIKKYNDQGNLF